jgi:hypothetical protein
VTAPYQQAPYQRGPHPYPAPQPVPPPWAGQPWAGQPYTGQQPYAGQPYAPHPYPGQPYPGPVFVPPARGPRPWVVAVIIGAAMLLLAVIVLAASASSSGGTTTTGGLPGPGPGPVGGQSGGPSTGDCPGGSLEGCYTESGMPQFLNQAVTFVRGFSDESYSRIPQPSGYRLIPTGEKAQSPCGALDAMTYAYCPADQGIYIGQKQLWLFYSEIGDAAAVVGLAHEYGHHIQTVAGVPNDRSAAGQVVHENQADCIAGAFVGWAERKGYLEDGDTQDIEGLVRAIASSEDDPGRDHGTLAERAAAMTKGINEGLPGCSTFYPRTPVHQS